MKPILAWLQSHVVYHRSSYIYVPAALLLLVLAIHGVSAMTGRGVQDSPEAIVGYLLDFFGGVLCIVLTKWAKGGHLFKRIDMDKSAYPWYVVLLDYVAVAFCMIFFAKVLKLF
jgi:hypothetical protein